MKFDNENTLKVLYVNIRSLKYKIDELTYLLDSLKLTIHLLIFTETWITEDEVDLVNIKHYNKVFACRKNRRGGGVGLFIHNSIEYKMLNIYNDEKNNLLCIKINTKQYNLNISTIYRSPDNNKNSLNNFFSLLESHLNEIKNNNSLVIGDFNFNIKNNLDKNVIEYKNIAESNGFFFCDDSTTRPISGTCLDHILKNNLSKKVIITHLSTNITDHNILLLEINENKFINKTTTQHKVIKTNVNQLKHHLSNCNIDTSSSVAEVICKNLVESVQAGLKTSTVEILNKKKIKYSKPWIDGECIQLIKTKNYWHRKHMQNINNAYIKEMYHFWLNKLTSTKRFKRKNYDIRKFNNCHNQQKIWNFVKEIATDGLSNIRDNEFFNQNDTTEDKINKINEFNNLYCKVGENMAKNYNTIYVPKSRTECRFQLKEINVEKTSRLIDSISTSNSSGYDGIKTSILKVCKNELIKPITKLINTSIYQNNFPSLLKINKIVPIYKKDGEKNNLNNFRPISISSVFSKVIETYVNNQLTEYLQDNMLISKIQYGFTKNSNTCCINSD